MKPHIGSGIAEVTGSNLVEALIFFRFLLSSCLNWKTHCEDHSSLSSITAVHMNYFIYTYNIRVLLLIVKGGGRRGADGREKLNLNPRGVKSGLKKALIHLERYHFITVRQVPLKQIYRYIQING